MFPREKRQHPGVQKEALGYSYVPRGRGWVTLFGILRSLLVRCWSMRSDSCCWCHTTLLSWGIRNVLGLVFFFFFNCSLLINVSLQAKSCMKHLKKTLWRRKRDPTAVAGVECRWRSKFLPVLVLDDGDLFNFLSLHSDTLFSSSTAIILSLSLCLSYLLTLPRCIPLLSSWLRLRQT